jgi:hypothetical protein
VEKDDRLRICIQTTEMKQAAWKYSHRGQFILDGTFGICDRWVLLFIALRVDEARKGVPSAFFLFSAPTGNKATHAGYDTSILVEVLNAWKNSLGSQNGVPFTPDIAITDTDTKERGALVHRALVRTWPDIWPLLCKFHIQQCWTNQRKNLLCMGNTLNFPKQQVKARLQALENL